ncbi:MAG TPA: amidohydrolase family protein [Planctomycetota bacterium]|nr:amidohydrolase family protein [Planctomycetota bacterium]
MPAFPIVDAHVHLWDPANVAMIWIDGNPVLDKKFLPPEFKMHTIGTDIEAIVYLETGVEPHWAFYEARWAALELAKSAPKLKAIVAAAPIEYGAKVRSYLKALTEISPLIKGIRRITQGEKDPAFCLQENFIQGAQLLHSYNLSCDLCMNFRQLGPTVELVKKCPDTQFIVDHISKPNIRERVLDPWREQMKAMAALSNTVCKVSGVLTEAAKEWTVDDVRPYVEHVLTVFGEDRVIFGGDWPVLLMAATYPRWVQVLDEITAKWTDAAKKKLWNTNAKKFYRL